MTPPATSPQIYEPVLRRTRLPAPLIEAADVDWRNGMLVRSTNWLGDALMTMPAVHKLTRFVSEPVGFLVLCPAALEPLWRAAPWVDGVIPMDAKRVDAATTAKIRSLSMGVGVILPNSFGAAWDLFGKGIPVRIGRRGRGRRPLLTHSLPEWARGADQGDLHQVNRYFEFAASLGEIAWDVQCPPLEVPGAEDVAAGIGLDDAATTPWLAVAPGAAYGPAKKWPVDYFGHVAGWWEAHVGRVVVVGTGAERGDAEALAGSLKHAVDLAGRTDLNQLMCVLKSCTAVVANDSGAMHLAAGLGTPGAAVFGSTDPAATGPLGAPWVVLKAAETCGPCFARTCPREEAPYDCLRSLEPSVVRDALTFLLENGLCRGPVA